MDLDVAAAKCAAIRRAGTNGNDEGVVGPGLAVILRLVFVLYAEERGLMSSSEVYVRNYALALFLGAVALLWYLL